MNFQVPCLSLLVEEVLNPHSNSPSEAIGSRCHMRKFSTCGKPKIYPVSLSFHEEHQTQIPTLETRFS